MKSIETPSRSRPGIQTLDHRVFGQTTRVGSALVFRSAAYPAIPNRRVSAVWRLAISVSRFIQTVCVRRPRLPGKYAIEVRGGLAKRRLMGLTAQGFG